MFSTPHQLCYNPVDVGSVIVRMRNELARRGFYVEHTSAVAVAALAHLPYRITEPGDEAQMVVLLTGHGLKIDPG